MNHKNAFKHTSEKTISLMRYLTCAMLVLIAGNTSASPIAYEAFQAGASDFSIPINGTLTTSGSVGFIDNDWTLTRSGGSSTAGTYLSGGLALVRETPHWRPREAPSVWRSQPQTPAAISALPTA
jgi:hypothetical protein